VADKTCRDASGFGIVCQHKPNMNKNKQKRSAIAKIYFADWQFFHLMFLKYASLQ